MTKIESRDLLQDVLKGIAVVLMIQVHITEVMGSYSFENSVLGKISLFLGGPIVAPMFLGILGYYLALSKKSFINQILRGVKIFLLGLLLNVLLNFTLIMKYFFNKTEVNLFEYLLGVDILLTAGVIIIIIAIIRKLSGNSILIFVIFSFLSFLIPDLFFNQKTYNYSNLQLFLISFVAKVSHWSYFPLFPWLGYSLLGYSLSLLFNKFNFNFYRTKLNIAILFLSLIYAVLFFWNGFNITINLQTYYGHGILYALWTICLSYIYISLMNLFIKSDNRNLLIETLKLWGKNVTLVYFIQWIIIGNIGTLIYKTQGTIQVLSWNVIILIFLIYIVPTAEKLVNRRFKLF